jgi:hypothetical protein
MAEREWVSASLAQAAVAGGIAVLAAGAAVWVGWMLGWPWVLDIDDPEFNPMVVFEALLIAVAVWHLLKALRWYLRHRAFGGVQLDLEGTGRLRLGKPLIGRVRVQSPVAATGPFRLVLTCIDLHETGVDEGDRKLVPFPVWTGEQQLPAETDAQQGLAFHFKLPKSVGPDPVPSLAVRPALRRSQVMVHVPGFQSVTQHNRPPVDRIWTLVVTAPVAGADFRCELQIPTHI